MGFSRKKFFIFGVGAGLGLLGLYFLVLSLANSFPHAISQFSQFWYWILILAVGFGLQVGLYSYIREAFYQKQIKSPTKVVATTGGISTATMIACCLHHLADVLPLMGLAAAALFLVQYQIIFIIFGIFSNLIGVVIMLEIMQKNNLSESFAKKIGSFSMGKLKKFIIGAAILTLIIVILFQFSKNKIKNSIIPEGNLSNSSFKALSLPAKIDSQEGITFTLTPLDFKFDAPVKFEVKINTHSGSLDFDLTQISILEDDKGNKYQAIEWQGSPAGGHHVTGTLVFPKLNDKTNLLKLIINNSRQRIFEWELK